MVKTHSTIGRKPRKPAKPNKPHKDFPLFPHATGKWAKKIRGKLHYFGKWNDPDGALNEYLEVKDDLLAGRKPIPRGGEFNVRDAVNHFLTAKQQLVDSGELSKRSFIDYKRTAQRLIERFGKATPVRHLTPQDFNDYRKRLSNTRGLYSVGNEVQRVRTIFKWCLDAELIEKPVRFGPDFKKPSRRVLRKQAMDKPKKVLFPEQILAFLDEASLQLRAMAMLGINCGYGNSDCGNLPLKAIDLDAGWIIYPRPKTSVERRSPLWPETVEVLRQALQRRHPASVPEARNLAFVTLEGLPWAKTDTTNPISKRSTAIFQRLKIHEPTMSFYWFRHTFATIGSQTGDQIAVNYLMGHADDSMAANYRHEIHDERLLAVTDHVRSWLYDKLANKKRRKPR